MNTFLKIGTVLPNGPDYLNINDLTLPNTIEQLGEVASGFNFTAGNVIDVASDLFEIVGVATAAEGGVLLGGENFIDTKINETSDFTIIAVIKPLKASSLNLVITSYTDDSKSETSKVRGFTLAQLATYRPTSAKNGFSFYMYNPAPINNKWVILALTRSGESVSTCVRFNGVSTVNSEICTNENQQQTSFGIGGTINQGSVSNQIDHSVYAYASIHNKSLDSFELKQCVDDLANELNLKNSNYNL